MESSTVILSQGYLQDLLTKSRNDHGIDPENAFIHVTDNEGVLSAQYFGAERKQDPIDEIMDICEEVCPNEEVVNLTAPTVTALGKRTD